MLCYDLFFSQMIMQMIKSSKFPGLTDPKAGAEDEVLEISAELYTQLSEIVPTPTSLDEISSGEDLGTGCAAVGEISVGTVSRYSKRLKLNNVKVEKD